MKSVPVMIPTPIAVTSPRASRDTRHSPFGTPHGLFGASPVQVGLARPASPERATQGARSTPQNAAPASPPSTAPDNRASLAANFVDANRIPSWFVNRLQMWSGAGASDQALLPGRALNGLEVEFTRALRKYVRTIEGFHTRIEREPVNALLLESMFRSCLKLVGLYKTLVSTPGFSPAHEAPPKVSRLALEGQAFLSGPGEGIGKYVRALGCFMGALCIEPRAADALAGLLQAAEQLSAVSWREFHAVPPELRETQRQLDGRQRLVEALLAPDRAQPERILPGAPRYSSEF